MHPTVLPDCLIAQIRTYGKRHCRGLNLVVIGATQSMRKVRPGAGPNGSRFGSALNIGENVRLPGFDVRQNPVKAVSSPIRRAIEEDKDGREFRASLNRVGVFGDGVIIDGLATLRAAVNANGVNQ